MKILREPAKQVLAAIPMTGLAIGMLAPFVRPDRVQIYVLLALCELAQAFLIFLWYRLDAGKRGYRRSRLLNTGIAGFTILALPYYLFRTRGFLGGCVAVFLVLLLALGTALMVFAGAIGGFLLAGS